MAKTVRKPDALDRAFMAAPLNWKAAPLPKKNPGALLSRTQVTSSGHPDASRRTTNKEKAQAE